VGIENVSGQLSLLRVHDRGTKFGPPTDQIDVEVVVQFAGQPPGAGAYGMQLRADANAPAREGMLALLRDGFNHGWIVNLDFDRPPGRKNVVLFRVWLTKPPRPTNLTQTSSATPAKTQPRTKTRAAKKAKTAKKAAKKRTTRRP
jgi:hypothetical protein